MTRPILKLGQGTYSGVEEQGVHVYRGIPYASIERLQPPKLRSSGNPDPRSSPIDASAIGAICPQLPSRLEMVTGPLPPRSGKQSDTECAVLTVCAPPDAKPGSKLPVVVFCHGGAFVSGSSQLGWYEGQLLAQEEVIAVSISYRLGVFGFLYNESVIAKEKWDVGVQDVFAAMQWVQDNIADFGGDPSNVCAMGQSAGGYLFQILSDTHPELFRRAIIMSSPCNMVRTLEQSKLITEVVLKTLSKDVTAATIEEILQAQRAAVVESAKQGFSTPFAPLIVDGISPGGRNPNKPKHDVLVGWTIDDASAFVSMGMNMTGWNEGHVELAERFRKVGDNVTVYKYNFQPEGSKFGAAHCADLPMFLGDEESWSKAPMMGNVPYSEWLERGRANRKMWMQFVKDGTVPKSTEEFTFGL